MIKKYIVYLYLIISLAMSSLLGGKNETRKKKREKIATKKRKLGWKEVIKKQYATTLAFFCNSVLSSYRHNSALQNGHTGIRGIFMGEGKKAWPDFRIQLWFVMIWLLEKKIGEIVHTGEREMRKIALPILELFMQILFTAPHILFRGPAGLYSERI